MSCAVEDHDANDATMSGLTPDERLYIWLPLSDTLKSGRERELDREHNGLAGTFNTSDVPVVEVGPLIILTRALALYHRVNIERT